MKRTTATAKAKPRRKTAASENVKKPGERVIRTYSIQRQLIEAADEFAARVKDETGMSCDRSKLVQLFFEMLVEYNDNIELSKVNNLSSLKESIILGLRER